MLTYRNDADPSNLDYFGHKFIRTHAHSTFLIAVKAKNVVSVELFPTVGIIPLVLPPNSNGHT